jgi:hypothetical protein
MGFISRNYYQNFRPFVSLICAVLALTCVVASLGAGRVAFAEPAYTINYQGKLADNTGLAVPNGTYAMSFALYTQASGGSAIWSESRTGGNEVTLTNGLFSVMLGEVASLAAVNFNQALYLGITVESDEEMTPRKPVGTVPSAIEAKQLGGVASSSFIRSDAADTASGLLTFTGGFQSLASSTITSLTTLTATTTNLIINGERLTDLTGTGLSNTGGVLTASLGTDITAAEIANGDHGLFSYASGVASLDTGGLTSANLSGALTNETGSGVAVFGTSPTFTNNITISGASVGSLTVSGSVSASTTISGSVGALLNLSGGLGSGTLNIFNSFGNSSIINLGAAGVRLSDDNDGALTFLGLGNGSDENFTMNLDDTSNEVVFTTSTGITKASFNSIALNTTSASGYQISGTTYFAGDLTNDSVRVGELAGATFTSSTIYNNAVGFEAGRYASTTNADRNNYVGYQAGYQNTGAWNNIIGYQSGWSNTGDSNNIFGSSAGSSNTGNWNNLLGGSAGYANTGDYNNSLGYLAGNANTGDYNNFLGGSAGVLNTGDYNNFMGYQTGYNNTGDYNAMIGSQTGRYLQSTTTVAIGAEALYGSHATTFISLNNVALGYRAGYASDDGSGNNIIIGYQAADNLTTGNNNIIIGYDIDNITATADNRLNIGNLIFGTGLDGTGTTLASGNVGIGTTSPSQKLEISGNLLLSAGASRSVTSAGGELILAMTGDTYGSVNLKLQNRSGSNGAIFQNPSLDLVDFGFLTSASTQHNIRFEGRDAYAKGSGNTAGEFQFGAVSGMSNPFFVTGTSTTAVLVGKFGVGDVTPSQLLDIDGTNPQGLFEESTTEFLRVGVGETAGTSVIGWDDSDSLRLGVYDSPTDTTISDLMTILSTGNVGIGTTTPAQKLQVYGDIRVGTTGSNGCIEDYGGGVIGGTCSSDERLKENIEPIATEGRSYLESLAALAPVTYNWNDTAVRLYGKNGNVANLGLVAQDVEALFPELVSRNEDGFRQVDFRALPFYIIEAMKELWAKVQGHDERLQSLEQYVKNLGSENEKLGNENEYLKNRISDIEGELGIDSPPSDMSSPETGPYEPITPPNTGFIGPIQTDPTSIEPEPSDAPADPAEPVLIDPANDNTAPVDDVPVVGSAGG